MAKARFDAAERKRLHSKLLALRAQLTGNLDYLGHEALVPADESANERGSAGGDHPGDAGTDVDQQNRMLGLLEVGERELSEIDDALARLGDGTYGECEACSKPIPKTRLRALPWARLCVKCQEDEEIETGGRS